MSNVLLPKISVIMPVYNDEKYLRESLDSFFAQSIGSQCELICINDGSTDGSQGILDEYSQVHPDNLVIIEQENSGSGKARNQGMLKAQGAYISFLDADDRYPSNKTLETLLRCVSDNDVSVAGGSLEMFDKEGVRITDFADRAGFEGHVFSEEGIISYRDYQFDYGYQRFVYEKKLLVDNAIVFPDFLRYQDPPFFVRAMIAAQKFYAVKETTYSYRSAVKFVTWDTKKTCDMIRGITSVGVLAAENNLSKLFALNLARFDQELLPLFRDLVVNQKNMAVLEALYHAKSTMLLTSSNLDLEILLMGVPSLVGDISQALVELDEAREEIVSLKSKVACLKDELAIQQAQYDECSAQLEDTLSSSTWKVGRAVTWAPRKIADYSRRG